MFDIDDLRTFIEVADTGGLTTAARRLGMAKSIVSRRLQRLEAEIGVQLLARNTRGVSLTEAGATFREHAARVCAELDAARETLSPEGELRGRLGARFGHQVDVPARRLDERLGQPQEVAEPVVFKYINLICDYHDYCITYSRILILSFESLYGNG